MTSDISSGIMGWFTNTIGLNGSLTGLIVNFNMFKERKLEKYSSLQLE